MASNYFKKALGGMADVAVTHYQGNIEEARQSRLEMLKGSNALAQERERGSQQRLGYQSQADAEQSTLKWKQDNPDKYIDIIEDGRPVGQKGPGGKATWRSYSEDATRVSSDKEADRTMQIQIQQMGLADTAIRMQTQKDVEDKRGANQLALERKRGQTQKVTTVIHEMNENLRNQARVEAQLAAARTAIMFDSDVPFFDPDGDYLEMRTQAHAYIDGKFYTVIGNQLMDEEEANKLLEGRATQLYDQKMADGDEDEAQMVLDNFYKSYGRRLEPSSTEETEEKVEDASSDSDEFVGPRRPPVNAAEAHRANVGSRSWGFGDTVESNYEKYLKSRQKPQVPHEAVQTDTPSGVPQGAPGPQGGPFREAQRRGGRAPDAEVAPLIRTID